MTAEFVCGRFTPDHFADALDPDGDWCCYGFAEDGPSGCTCWVPVYDLEQTAPDRDAPRGCRTDMCADCAYRPDSPERTGDDSVRGDEDTLMALADGAGLFFCHQGIRRPVRWVHPSGAVVPGDPANYDPPMVDGVPFRADGTPADLCAGWLARFVHNTQRGVLS